MSPMNKTSTAQDVAALVSFLADSNEGTVSLAKTQLKQILRTHPAYRKLLENPPDPAIAGQAKAFLEETRLEDLKEAFRALAGQGRDLELEQGVVLLAQSAYPGLQASAIPHALDHLAEGIEKELDAEEASSARAGMIPRRSPF